MNNISFWINRCSIGIISFSLFPALLSNIMNEIGVLTLALLLIFFGLTMYSLAKLKKRIILFIFQMTMFNFLLGSVFFSFFEDGTSGLEKRFSDAICYKVVLLLYISQLGLLIGYIFFEKSKKTRLNKQKNLIKGNSDSINAVSKKISGICLILCLVPFLMIEVEKALFVQANAYKDLYISFSSFLPYIIIKMAQLYKLFFWIYLLSNPSKKYTFIVLFFDILASFIGFGYGKRSPFIISILMAILYLSWRNKRENTEKWINYKIFIWLLILSPLIFAGLQVFTYVRMDLQVASNTLFGNIKDYFSESSVSLIGYGISYQDRFPDGNYTFGALWTSMVRNNTLVDMVLNIEPLRNQTVEMAMNGNIYGQTITYLVMPRVYFSGGGMGSCYIAEAYHDYSYLGVVLVNVFYGLILFKFDDIKNDYSLITKVFYFFMIESILIAPRDSVFAFIYKTFTPTNIVILFIYIILVRLILKKQYVT